MRKMGTVPILVVALAAATFFHHAHNAEFLEQYPNMPPWLSRASVYGAWLAATAVGLAGYFLFSHGWRRAGAALLVLYGCYGLDGLLHYALAPMSAHSNAMNISIWLEAVTGSGLLVALAGLSSGRREP